MFNIAHPGNSTTMPRIGFSRRAYPMADKQSDQAIATRDLAKRAWRLAGTLTAQGDVARCFATLTSLRPKLPTWIDAPRKVASDEADAEQAARPA